MSPVLVIVGRANVGKSTLFNYLTHGRRALVADRPGVTRDFQSAEAYVAGRLFTLIDTGGMGGSGEGLEAAVERQAMQATRQAGVLLWLVDGLCGTTSADLELADRLRRLAQPCLLIVNKTEGLPPEQVATEFYALGMGEPICISARCGDGVRRMLELALPAPAPPAAAGEAAEETPATLQVAIVGRPNAGKSTLVNRLLGQERMLTDAAPGTTRDSIASDLRRLGLRYRLVDTAGVRRRARINDAVEKFSIAKSLVAIKEADVVLLMVDAVLGAAEQDVRLYRQAQQRGKPLLTALNKWDGLSAEQRRQARESLELLLRFDTRKRIHPVSALHGSGLGALFLDLERIRKALGRQIGTAFLNRVLEKLVQQLPPPARGRHRSRLLHAHLGGKRPPRVIVHGRRLQQLPQSYRVYLERGFSLALHPEGLVPVQVEFRQDPPPASR